MYSHGDLSFDLYNAKTKTIETISYSDDLTKSMNGDITAMNSLNHLLFFRPKIWQTGYITEL